jgi:acrylyl-CoA reductase (NADPH)
MSNFHALVLDEAGGKVKSAVKSIADEQLPEGDVTIAVAYSTLNYKDGLILNGLGKLVRKYPHIGGVDFSGTVEASSSPLYKKGESVVLTGWRVGELHWGGYAQKARVKADWLVPLAAGLTLKQAMAIGTAGFTSMLSVLALERHGLKPGAGEVLVTGAAGGVGSVAVAILAKLGYEVAASTGRKELHGYLKSLGAATIIDRAELAAPGKPMQSERWAGVIDSVGGPTLANAIAQTRYNASVAACGLAGGNELPVTVLPFILRGVNLLGIDSSMKSLADRREAWQRLARDLPLDKLDSMTSVVGLHELPSLANDILAGKVRGRTVVDVNKLA